MAQKVAYLDCFSGVSGDMLLGAFLDAGLPESVLRQELSGLGLSGYKLLISRKDSRHLRATRIEVETLAPQPVRTLVSIRDLLITSGMADRLKKIAFLVFETLARAEARVHGVSMEDVHFHEVGAVDAIIDVVGATIGLAHFKIEQLICSPLPLSHGWVSCAHGRLPLPAPAVCEILKDVPVYGVALDQELVTPTGAALVKALSHGFGPFPCMTMKQVGYGAGSRERSDALPNLLRLVIGEACAVAETQSVEVIETNIDDWTPEGFPFLSERLFESGALDVALIPMQMKKGRPGFLLRVISIPELAFELKRLILSESTAIGLRYHREERLTLPRLLGRVSTAFGDVQVKLVETPAGPVLYPEYEDCRRLAREQGVFLREIYQAVARCGLNDFIGD